jgi:hypothetical protein
VPTADTDTGGARQSALVEQPPMLGLHQGFCHLTCHLLAHGTQGLCQRLQTGGQSSRLASSPSNQRSTSAGNCWQARVLTKAARWFSYKSTAAVAIGGSSTGGVRAYLLLRPSHSGVRERSARKTYVIHPLRDANGWAIQLPSAHLAVEELVPLITAPAYHL